MTKEEFFAIDWHEGNNVRLDNGKEYTVVKMLGGDRMLLHSHEYHKSFLAYSNIIVERTGEHIFPKEQIEAARERRRQRGFERDRLFKAEMRRQRKLKEARERALRARRKEFKERKKALNKSTECTIRPKRARIKTYTKEYSVVHN